ncbi:hypothetical protein RchiOBHm_Chr6g0246771 [Rosa chinensis]|uniref:Uncharacterized protein n=1 Tax=Rosa chinensis TaxID=74649 RepID=A0A2P6PJL5_ROSCH|nr:hypothetical protein RchiOBHm_Chr6g0246771 [Rosa chinensis]
MKLVQNHVFYAVLVNHNNATVGLFSIKFILAMGHVPTVMFSLTHEIFTLILLRNLQEC